MSGIRLGLGVSGLHWAGGVLCAREAPRWIGEGQAHPCLGLGLVATLCVAALILSDIVTATNQVGNTGWIQREQGHGAHDQPRFGRSHPSSNRIRR